MADVLKKAQALAAAANEAADAAILAAQQEHVALENIGQKTTPLSTASSTTVAISSTQDECESLNRHEVVPLTINSISNSAANSESKHVNALRTQCAEAASPAATYVTASPKLDHLIENTSLNGTSGFNGNPTATTPPPTSNRTESVGHSHLSGEQHDHISHESTTTSLHTDIDADCISSSNLPPPSPRNIIDAKGTTDDDSPSSGAADVTDAPEPRSVLDTLLQDHLDKRSKMVDRRKGPVQVVCYICCGEFGTNSLLIHQKTCLKKHAWGLDNVANDETIPKKLGQARRRQCCDPSDGSELPPLPSAKSTKAEFELFNNEALRTFFEHVQKCLWCRMHNPIAKQAMEDLEHARNMREADAEARRRALEDAARRRALEDEEARRREEEEARRRALEEAEEAARRRVEEEARRMAQEDELARRIREEEEEAERRRRLLAKGKHTFLKRGEGTVAASQTAKVMHEKEADEIARQDIAQYSLAHAKKRGVLTAAAPKVEKPSVAYDEMDENMEKVWDKHWSAEEEAKFAQQRVMENEAVETLTAAAPEGGGGIVGRAV